MTSSVDPNNLQEGAQYRVVSRHQFTTQCEFWCIYVGPTVNRFGNPVYMFRRVDNQEVLVCFEGNWWFYRVKNDE